MAAIDFPSSPSNGQTYDYNGIRFTYLVTGSTGVWQVTTPGTYGVASSAEIDAGTDAVKYVTPQELEASKYVREDDTSGVTILDY